MHPLHAMLHRRIVAIQSLCEYDPLDNVDYWVNDWQQGNLRFRAYTDDLLSKHHPNV